MILIIDNYDSFVYNLYQFVAEFTSEVKVVRNDEITIEEIKKMNPKGILISPGPGKPENSNISLDIIKELGDDIAILGICLGHQAIAISYNSIVEKHKEIIHGKKTLTKHFGNEIFNDVEKEFEVMRYHSLVINRETLSDDLEIISELSDKTIMGVKHKSKKIYGLQFHPESIGTNDGKQIIKNFIEEICNEYK